MLHVLAVVREGYLKGTETPVIPLQNPQFWDYPQCGGDSLSWMAAYNKDSIVLLCQNMYQVVEYLELTVA